MRKTLLLLPLAALTALLATSGNARVTAGSITGHGKLPHLEFIVLHKLHGHEAFQWPQQVQGRASDLLRALEHDAQFVVADHTAGLQDGDVLMINADVLRPGAGKGFDDLGVDCQLVVHEKGGSVSVSGRCDFMVIDQDGRMIDHKGIIPATRLSPGGAWQLAYRDAEDGIAIYVHEAFGSE